MASLWGTAWGRQGRHSSSSGKQHRDRVQPLGKVHHCGPRRAHLKVWLEAGSLGNPGSYALALLLRRVEQESVGKDQLLVVLLQPWHYQEHLQCMQSAVLHVTHQVLGRWHASLRTCSVVCQAAKACDRCMCWIVGAGDPHTLHSLRLERKAARRQGLTAVPVILR